MQKSPRNARGFRRYEHYVTVNVSAAVFADNIRDLRARVAPAKLCVVMKADAYGHGLERLAPVAAGADSIGICIVGVMTHLANADGEDLEDARRQLEEFWRLRREVAESLPPDVITRTHNSAATIRLPALRADLVRVGAACYGVRTSRAFENPPELKPGMSMKTRVMEVRSVPAGRTIGYGSLFSTERASRIATIPVGFGEGYPRALFNKGIVLIRGRRCPVVGRVSLNITTIDVTELDGDIEPGEEVTLVGAQGAESITFEELADKFSSVHTEINVMAGHMNERSYER